MKKKRYKVFVSMPQAINCIYNFFIFVYRGDLYIYMLFFSLFFENDVVSYADDAIAHDFMTDPGEYRMDTPTFVPTPVLRIPRVGGLGPSLTNYK